MAQRPDIQYIQFYTDGSAARQLQPKAPRKKKRSSVKSAQRKPQVIYLDPLALGGILVSAVMLVLMVIGCVQLLDAQQEALVMENYVASLRIENAELTAAYESGYDLEEVEKTALALGMVPVEQVKTISIALEKPQSVEEPTYWQKVCVFFENLFA